MRFISKTDAVKSYNKFINNTNKSINQLNAPKYNLKFFQEDVQKKSVKSVNMKDEQKTGAKCFHVEDPKAIYNRILKSSEPHFYESWTENTKLVFGVDVDFKLDQSDKKPEEILNSIIKIIIMGAKKYYDHEYKISDIIVLENDQEAQKIDNPNKYSAHIIFRGLNFINYLATKDFYLRLDKDYKISQYFVDKAIYNLTCFRLFLNSKMGRSAILVPKRLKIESEHTKMPNQYKDIYDYFLDTMMTHTISTDRLIDKKDLKFKQEISMPNMSDASDISNVNVANILAKLPYKYCNEYELWRDVGMCLHSHENYETNTLFKLWDEWSSQCPKYKKKEMLNVWKSFGNSNKKKYTIGTLIKRARDEGIPDSEIFNNNKQSVDEIVQTYPEKPIQLNLDDFDKSQITMMNVSKFVPDNFIPLLNKKLVAVQSEKGTGKTSNLFSALFNSKESWITSDTSILIISSRITFGYKIFGDVANSGFELYSEITGDIYSKRLICQINSLLRVKRDSYDIIIVDEAESLSRYLTSDHLTKDSRASLTICEYEMRLQDAAQVYIMDADLSDRCINYYHNAMNITSPKDFHLIVNEYKAYTDYTLMYCNNYNGWIREIQNKLEDNKRLVIAMASNAKAKDLNKYLLDYYADKKVLLIHKETSDEDKKALLLKVNDEWIKYDVIIYTPSVCMGVSFDIIGHFDHIFAYGCHESLGAQEWSQMMHRVRSPKSKKIYVVIDQYKKYNELEDTLTYQTVEKMLCTDYYLTNYNLHNNIVKKEVKRIRNQSDLDEYNNIISAKLDKNIDNFDNDTDDDFDDNIKNIDDNINIHVPALPKRYTNKNSESVEPIGPVQINDKVLYYPYRNEAIYDLYVRNCWEIVENKLNFPACFFGYAKYKGYKFQFIPSSDEDNLIGKELKNIREEREQIELETKANGITNAKDLNQEEFQNIVKFKDEHISEEDLYAIKKYNLRNCYDINLPADDEIEITEENENISNGVVTVDFVMEYCDSSLMMHYRNLATVLSTSTQSTADKLMILKENQQYDSTITSCYIDFTRKNKYMYHYYALTIIELLGFDINDLSISILTPDLMTNTYDAVAWAEPLIEEMSFKFGLKKFNKELTKASEIEQLKFLNQIIKAQYGLWVRKINNPKNKDNVLYRLDDNEIWKNLPDRPNDLTPEELLLPENIYSLKRKIVPKQLFLKKEYKTNFDTSNLDIDIFDDEI